jgi:YD repeat-containing protein
MSMQTTPDDSVTLIFYNEAGLLESLAVKLRGAGTATDFVDNIDYDAHGRRTKLQAANGVLTTYEYNAETFRLTRILSTRDAVTDSDGR